MKNKNQNNECIRCVPMYSFVDPTPEKFYQHPKFLEYDSFAELSSHSRLLYVYMRDRVSLSLINKFEDEQNRLYILFPVNEAAQRLRVSYNTASAAFCELEKCNLIKRVKTGIGKPSKIFVYNVITE